jgi:hypothetical protein
MEKPLERRSFACEAFRRICPIDELRTFRRD